MRTTIDIDANLLRKLREEAHRHGVTLKDILHRVLQRGLAERPPSKAPQYRVPTFNMGAALAPLDKALALAAALEDKEALRDLNERK